MSQNEIILPLSPCPWCRTTPYMAIFAHGEDTWKWYIECHNGMCSVNPKGKHVNIRKKQKNSVKAMLEKICKMTDAWNKNNPIPPFEGKVIKLAELIATSEVNHDQTT